MHRCEVMLKDTEDSRRLSHKIQSDVANQLNGIRMEALMVSSYYWPSLSDESDAVEGILNHLHPRVLEILEMFRSQYNELKKPRKLKFYPQLGAVDFTVKFNDGTKKDFHVNPILVRFLEHALIGFLNYTRHRFFSMSATSPLHPLPLMTLSLKWGM